MGKVKIVRSGLERRYYERIVWGVPEAVEEEKCQSDLPCDCACCNATEYVYSSSYNRSKS